MPVRSYTCFLRFAFPALLLLPPGVRAEAAPAKAPKKPAAKPSGGVQLPSKMPNAAPVAVVNGETIPISLYVDRLSLKYGLELREALIEEVLLRQEAEKRKLKVTLAEIDGLVKRVVADSAKQAGSEKNLAGELNRTRGWTLDDYRGVIREQAPAQLYKEKIAASLVSAGKVTDKEIESFYSAQRANFTEADSALISHVLVRKPLQNDLAANRLAKEKAEAILARIKLEGAGGFEKAAKEDSDDKITGPMGGKIPTPILRGAHPFGAAFEATVFGSGPAGLVDEVVETPTGFHIIRVESRKEGRQLPLAEVKERIRTAILEQKRATALEELYVRLRSSAKVETGRF
jgi:parvulin-like peptidyl-prolyl isomerase